MPRPARRPAVGNRAVDLVCLLLGIAALVLPPLLAISVTVYGLATPTLPMWAFAAVATLAFLLVKTLLPRSKSTPPAVVTLTADDEPLAVAFVARVAADLGAPAPRRFRIASGVELGIGGTRSLLDLVRVGSWDLTVGLWLWHHVTLSEFQALVARTLAPLSRGRAERFRRSLRALLDAMVSGSDAIDEWADSPSRIAAFARWYRGAHRTLTYPSRLVGRTMLRLAPTNDDVLADDLVAVSLSGSDALVHALARTDFAAATLERIDVALRRSADLGVVTADLCAHSEEAARSLREAHNDFTLGQLPTLRGPMAGKRTDIFDEREPLSRIWPAEPSLATREHHAKRDFVPAERDERPAVELLVGREALAERLTRARLRDVMGIEDSHEAVDPRLWSAWQVRETPFDDRYAGCYDDGRVIDPGLPAERDAALAEAWDDHRLVGTARGLHARAGDRARSFVAARRGIAREMRRSLYNPGGAARRTVDALDGELRTSTRWLNALDRWSYVVHLHMAARLTDLALHDELVRRYDALFRLQPLAADARDYRLRLAAFLHRLDEFDRAPTIAAYRDANREYALSRKDFKSFLRDVALAEDAFLVACTGGLPVASFVHTRRPPLDPRKKLTRSSGDELMRAWEEIDAKLRWLSDRSVAALLGLQETIVEEFVASLPPEVEPPLMLEVYDESSP